MNHMIKTMDVRVVTATKVVHGASSLCILLPPQTKLGRSVCNSQIQCRICKRKADVRDGSPRGNQFGPGGPSRLDKEMILLRELMEELRLHEAKHAPPHHWMKWEKDWFITCASGILRWLQNILIHTRHAIAIALALMLLLFFSSLKYFKSQLLKSRWPSNF